MKKRTQNKKNCGMTNHFNQLSFFNKQIFKYFKHNHQEKLFLLNLISLTTTILISMGYGMYAHEVFALFIIHTLFSYFYKTIQIIHKSIYNKNGIIKPNHAKALITRHKKIVKVRILKTLTKVTLQNIFIALSINYLQNLIFNSYNMMYWEYLTIIIALADLLGLMFIVYLIIPTPTLLNRLTHQNFQKV